LLDESGFREGSEQNIEQLLKEAMLRSVKTLRFVASLVSCSVRAWKKSAKNNRA